VGPGSEQLPGPDLSVNITQREKRTMPAVRVQFQLQAEVERVFTGFKGTYEFRKGVFTTTTDSGKVEKLTRVMKTFYGAERIHGAGEVQQAPTNSGAGSEVSLPGGVRPSRQGPATSDAPAGAEPAGAQGGAAGSVPGGDGHEDTRDDGTEDRLRRLREAVTSLDSLDDENWTADGRPRIDAVEKAFGRSGVTRADVDKAAPGFIRPE
jgi:hypothetical protein